MRLLVDGDACPDKQDIKALAIKYQVEMYVYIDYAHVLSDDYYQVIECEIGQDSVDMMIVCDVQPNDIVITQDYGLASLLLGKNVRVLHISGLIIDNDNIDLLLVSRYISAKQRRIGKHTRGPTKRTETIREKFLNNLEYLLRDETIHSINE